MISINLTLFVQMSIFLAVLFILNRLLFRPILRTFDERARRVEEALARARALEAETARRMADYQAQMEAARAEGAGEQDQLRKTGTAEAERLLVKVHEETGNMIGELRERIAREYQEALAVLKKEAEAMSRQVGARVLGRSIQ